MDCPSCGATTAAGARFCWSCGHALRAPTEERRVVTVVFADLVGFTALSEHLDPEQVKRLVDHAFERLVRDVTAFGGRVDKIVGDAIVALFGAPVAHEDDAERAVRSALRMQETLAAYAAESDARIRMRIGVNTGEVLVGALRAGGDYTAMGDVMNTASRLQTLAEPGEVLVGENTHAVTSAVITYDSRGALVPRGREHPIDVWTAVGATQPPGYRPRQRATAPLIGRDREMDSIADALRLSIGRGRGQMVLILGEAGVGKTRLANEVSDVAAAEHGAARFGGRCVPYGEANPWWPVAEALRAGCGVRRDDPVEVARAATAVAVAKVCNGSGRVEPSIDELTGSDIDDWIDLDGPSPDGPSPDRAAPDRTAVDRTAPDRTAPDRTAPDRTAVDAAADACAVDGRSGGDASGGGATTETIDSIVHGLLHLMGYDGPLRNIDGPTARAEATHALVTFLEASLRQRPIMIRVADLHWADQAVLDLIDDVSERLARLPFALLATARRPLQERWTPRMGRFNTLVMNLDPLDRGSSALLLDTLAGSELDQPTRSILLDRSGGNPFYLEELVTLLGQQRRDGRPGADPERAEAAHDDARGPDSLPDTLRGLVAARIDGLDAQEQQVLEDAAVWGPSGTIDVLDRIAAAVRSVDHVAPVVQTLADKDIIVFDGVDWSFRSDLIREVAYARLTKQERFLRHWGIAEYLERQTVGSEGGVGVRVVADDSTVDTIARHYVVAARLDRDLGRSVDHHRVVGLAVRWALEAAGRAEADAAWPLARRLYTQAIDLLGDADSGESGAQRFRSLIGRSRARAEAWDEPGARRDAQRALGLADVLGVPVMRAHALVRLGTATARSGDVAASDANLAEAIEIFDAAGDSRGSAEALRQRGLSELLRGDQRAGEPSIAAALEEFRAIGDRRGEAWSLQNLAWIALFDGRLDAADRYIAESEEAFREVGDLGGLSWAQGLAAHSRLQQGDLEAAAALSERILVESERRGDRFGEGMMLTVRATVELWRGQTTAAAASAARAVTAFRSSTELAGTVGLEQALVVAARAEIMSGNMSEGRALFADASRSVSGEARVAGFALGAELVTGVQLGLPDRLLDVDVDTWLHAAGEGRVAQQQSDLAMALAQVGRTDEALALARSAVHADPNNGHAVAACALVAAAAGELPEADAAAERVLLLPVATYLDRVSALVAIGLIRPGERGTAALDVAVGELASTEDVVSIAIVGLASFIRRLADAGELPDAAPEAVTDLPGADSSDAVRALARLGLAGTRWSHLFVGIANAALS